VSDEVDVADTRRRCDGGCVLRANSAGTDAVKGQWEKNWLQIPGVMVARSVRGWRGVSMGRNVDRGPLPTAEQEEGFSLLIIAYFISHSLIT
jgi:hypothetical protein